MTARDRSQAAGTIDEASLLCFRRAVLYRELTASGERKCIMVRFDSAPGRRRARGRPCGAVGCERPDRAAGGGADGDGTSADDGAFADSASEGEAAPDGAAEARKASGSGRAADHGACPAVLSDRRHAGSRGHGAATATSTTPSTSRRRSRGPSRACAAGKGSPTNSAPPRLGGFCSNSELGAQRFGRRSGRREQRLDRNLKSRRIELDGSFGRRRASRSRRLLHACGEWRRAARDRG